MFEQFIPKHPSMQNGGRHLRWKWGVLKWFFFQLKPRRTKLLAGKGISLQGKLRLCGPGTVILKDNVIIADNVDLYTHDKNAVIEIGENTFLNGTRMSSVTKIEIGMNNILADVRIMDTDFHWLHADRMTDKRPPPSAKVVTEKNVWIAAGSAVMKGTRIGENSVIAFGSVLTTNVPSNEVWGGVPAKKIREVPARGEENV